MTRKSRHQLYGLLFYIFTLTANIIALVFLGLLLVDIFVKGNDIVDLDFLTSGVSRFPEKAGILSAWVGSIWVMVLTALFSIPMGIGAAIYLEEYTRNTPFIRVVKINIQNLAGVPSIVYGILGLTLFVRGVGLGQSLLAGAMTMALLILPIITIAAQEALRAVPDSFRWAGYGIGMTRWQVVRYQVMPLALPGVATGTILALSRAIGETAPLIVTGAMAFVRFLPSSPMDPYTILPLQIYDWTKRPQAEFHDLAAGGIIVLMVLLLMLNALAIYMRAHFKKKFKDVF